MERLRLGDGSSPALEIEWWLTMRKVVRGVVLGGVLAVAAWAEDPDITINELLYRPPEGLDDAEFIEFFNSGSEAVDLSGWRIDDGVAYTFPGGASLEPGAYLLVVKDLALAAGLYAGTPLFGPYTGSLANGGERLRVVNAAGVLIDEFSYDDGDEFTEEADGTGASLEKRAAELDPWYGESWAASVTLLGSPGKLNTQFRELVELELVLVGEDWRFLRGLSEPTAVPGEWAQPSYDDTAWETGPTGIGYGDSDDATVLDDMLGLYTTVYLRQSFDVADPAKVESLLLEVDYDDGFVLYLNGVEVARRNVGGPAGTPLAFDALALGNHEAGTPERIDLTAHTGLLVQGPNLVAIHGINQTLTSTDFSLAPSLSAEVEVLGTESSLNRLATSSVVPSGAAWRYFKGTVEPSVDPGGWTQAGFDDSSWPFGLAGFGYSDGDDVTVLDDMQNGYTTLYLRHAFSVGDTASVVGMTLGVNYDDGFIAYLNGVEVARANAPGVPGEFAANTATTPLTHEATGEETFDLTAHLGLLSVGDNLLAIQGVNGSLGSSDFSLSPRLTLTTAVEGDPETVLLGVTINEVYAPGDGTGWVEILNGCCDPVDLEGFGLSSDAGLPQDFTFPAGSVIAAGTFLQISEAELGFPLAARATLVLTDSAGVVLVDGKTYEITDPSLSAGSFPDGEVDVEVLGTPTPGSANVAPADFGVVINEIMYHPLADPGAEEVEWIELCNRGAAPVDLTGWAFTRGVDFEFPPGTVILAGGYLVVANDPAAVEAEYGIAGVIGGHASGLQNDDELLLLRNHLGNIADRVHYADDGRWDPAADGGGPSLELVHPALDNRSGLAWRASAGAGTPGAQNSSFSTTAPPVVSRVRHAPLVPGDGQSVTVTAEVSGLEPIAEVRLFHRLAGAAGSPPNPFSQILMHDDGASGDGAAGDGVFGAFLPGQPIGTVVEFFLEAEDAGTNVQIVPATAPDENHLYIVDAAPGDLGVPGYRVVMTPEDRFELESRDVQSDVLLNGAFIDRNEVFYRVGVRYRGKSSRLLTPKSYRVEFTDDEEYHGTKRLNLNANRPQHQLLGMALFRNARVPASLARLVAFTLNDDPVSIYCQMEAVDDDLLSRVYPEPNGEDEGNLYRGIENGNLDYRGPDPDPYRPSYEKKTNEYEDDWSGLIALTDALTNTPESELPAVLPTVIDVDEWIRFFVAHALISTHEGGLARDRGDDYFAYRRPSDGLWVLIPWDLDDSFVQPTERLFRPTLFQIMRILQHPEWVPSFYRHLVELGSTHFSQENMAGEIGALSGLFPQAALDADLTFVSDRLTFIDSRINLEFSALLTSVNLVSAGAEWRFFRGTSEPSGGTLAWVAPDFEDSGWEIGPSGIGYGDGDDATLLADMQNLYSTVYMRHAFEVVDPADYPTLQLAMNYDDGFVAFLNGVEIGRANAGASGTFPTFDAFATTDHEAGSFETFDFDPAGLLVPGTNVLAIVGLNATLESTDFSLIPEIRIGGVVGEACTGDFYVSGGQLVLTGLAPVTQARRVLVDGVEADYDSMTGEWSYQAPLVGNPQTVLVEVLDVGSQVIASESITVTHARTLGGVLVSDTVLTALDSPYLVVGTLTVPSGTSLTIEPGCELLLEEGVNLLFDGQVQALGSELAPIVFTRVPCHDNWGYMRFQSNRNSNVFNHCDISYATGNPGALTVRSSNIELNHCHIDRIAGEGVNSSGSTNTIRHTLVERTNEALSLDFGVTVVEFSTVRNVIGKSDLIDANGSNNPPARIAYNLLHGTSDDGIDADRGAVFAEANIIRNCSDQAMSLVGAGSSTVIRNCCFRCTHGLSVKNGHVCLAEFNTFAYHSQTGVRAIERTAGNPGGIITLVNSIVWGNGTSLFVNSDGVITTTYCDVEGALVPGVGNLNVDPLFIDPSNNDFHLQAGSPCIGAADNGDDLGAYPFETIPRAPSDLVVVGATGDSISLGWKDNSFAEDSYELERRTSAGFTPQTLVAVGDTWRFFRGATDPSGGTLDWTTPGFDDSGWESGATGIGYGDGDDATVLSDMQNGYSTVYLRKTFDVADAAALQSLELRIDFDDGFVAFLNGVEVARQFAGRPGVVIPFDGLSEGLHEAGETVSIEFSTSGILQDVDNVFAIQGLNASLDSSDLSIVPELRTTDPAPFVTIATLPSDTLVHMDVGLAAATRYSYRVRALNPQGPSGYSNIVSQETIDIPSGPSGLVVTGVGATSISLAWTDNSDVEESYVVERAEGDGGFADLPPLAADSESFSDTGLMTGETYRYRVRAVNTYGSSPFSNTVTQTTGSAPAAPTGLVISAVFVDALELSWMDNAADETAYEVEVRFGGAVFQQRAVLSPDTTVYLDEELEPGEAYTYRVRAVNLIGPSEFSNEVTGETGRLPLPPVDLTVTNATLDEISLSWVDASDNEEGFELERRGPGDVDFQPLASIGAGVSDYVDGGLPEDTTFEYRVYAVNSFGASGFSNVASGTTGRLPDAPSGLTVVDVGLETIELAWIDNADNEDGYELERRQGAGAYSKIADLSDGTTSFLDVGLARGTEYGYRVRAVSTFGVSPYSGEVTATTGRLPDPPSGLSEISVTNISVTISWLDNSDNETSFEVERSGEGSPFFVVGSLAPNTTAFSDSGLAAGTEYGYRVRAINAFGPSAWSNELVVVTGALPAAPSGLTVVAVTESTVELAWADVAGNETGYEVERRLAGEDEFALVAALPAGATGVLDEGLSVGVTYEYRVRAVNPFGASSYAGPVSASTTSLAPRILSIAPSEGPTSGGTEVRILGENFAAQAGVTFGDVAALDVAYRSAGELVATAPQVEARGRVDVVVSTDGGSATLPEGFAYYAQVMRGDINLDEERDLSDAVAVVNFLFLGGLPPLCEDVARINTDAEVDLSDAVFLLNWLFLGGPEPTPGIARCF